ncbi:hypothetical protein BC938DRAFT_482740 [Jimgerdemannia flammicorona]|uniref:Uncharacterized protein n=1 Tax=Jimgerdemannia flammicorona TaxID=994334 RepID=A0A433QWC4_9FUNG|nr:hypothetical protein BC938DRAFT_482740 [Jimgerdemannia flammicorona]
MSQTKKTNTQASTKFSSYSNRTSIKPLPPADENLSPGTFPNLQTITGLQGHQWGCLEVIVLQDTNPQTTALQTTATPQTTTPQTAAPQTADPQTTTSLTTTPFQTTSPQTTALQTITQLQARPLRYI